MCQKTTSTNLVRLPRDTANTILQTRHIGKARLSIEPVRRALCIILFLGASFSIGLVEQAIRTRAKDRQARAAKIAETTGARADDRPVEVLRNRDPVSFLNRRAEALAQRSADIKKLADAWQPLYGPEQKRRMAAIAIFVLHDMSDAVEKRRL